MTQDELLSLLRDHEWRDIEFKEARSEVPRSAYETVSAFANTEGGHLVFGVKKDGVSFDVVGVLDVDKIQGDFLSTLRQHDKISVILDIKESLHNHDGKHILVFYVPEAHRSQKPVFLNGNSHRSFIRKGGCDVKCSNDERNRFLVDAAADRYDGVPVELDPGSAFDSDSIRWYRNSYEMRPGNRSNATLTDVQFLGEMGLLVERNGRQMPSRAAILLFGNNPAFRQLLPRPIVDCQRFSQPIAEADVGERWSDRLVADENLIQVWQQLFTWYEKLVDRPFRIDPATLQRDDAPPDYRAYREAMVNLLIHQDYSDHCRKPEIRHYTDQTVFWNPGDAFAVGTDLLEPGEKEVRNPRIVTAFRRIGLSENAGWGLRDVFRNWQQLGHVPPEIINDKAKKTFQISLRKEDLLSERQILFQASLGVQLSSDAQVRAVALASREEEVTISQLKAVLGLTGLKAIELADALVTQMLFKAIVAGKRYALADHLKVRFRGIDQEYAQVRPEGSNLVTAQPTPQQSNLITDQASLQRPNLVIPKLTKLTGRQGKILTLCEAPRSQADLMKALGLSHRAFFRRTHLEPLIQANLVRMTCPEKPKHPRQAYVVTEHGLDILASWKKNAGAGDKP